MTRVVIPAHVVALLERTRDSLASTAREAKSLPRWLPNGEEIATIPQLAAVLNIDSKTAAYVVLNSHRPPAGLVAEAKDVYAADRSGGVLRPVDGPVSAPFATGDMVTRPRRQRRRKAKVRIIKANTVDHHEVQ